MQRQLVAPMQTGGNHPELLCLCLERGQEAQGQVWVLPLPRSTATYRQCDY